MYCMVRVVSLSKAKFLFEFASFRVDYYSKKTMTRILHLSWMDKHNKFLMHRTDCNNVTFSFKY
jgi:hypothetical protein